MQTLKTATIADVEKALAAFKGATIQDPRLEAKAEKKLAAVVMALAPKDDVTKDLSQAYTNGEKWHAVSAKKNLHGCTAANELEKIKEHIQKTAAYARHYGNSVTMAKVEQWFATNFVDAANTNND